METNMRWKEYCIVVFGLNQEQLQLGSYSVRAPCVAPI